VRSTPVKSAASRPWAFDEPGLLDALEEIPLDGIDEIGFGLIVMNRSGEVTGYNAFESKRSGLRVERVLGRNFFADVGPCTNNYLVAQRFSDCAELDEQLDYVFTFRMAPTPVRLRLLARAGSPRQYLAVRFR
jgi:photoactive yellow protein